MFPVPHAVIKDLNKIIFSLMWGDNKPDLVARKVISLSNCEGGLNLDCIKDKMDALFVKPLLPMFRTDTPLPTYLVLARFFTAKFLRMCFPHIWSNCMPNSSVCSKHLVHACHTVRRLFTESNTFVIVCKHTKDIVRFLREPVVGNDIACVRHNPHYPWSKIWFLAFSHILDNKLKDFQWRLAHDVLYTGERIKKWGIGDGICPMIAFAIVLRLLIISSGSALRSNRSFYGSQYCLNNFVVLFCSLILPSFCMAFRRLNSIELCSIECGMFFVWLNFSSGNPGAYTFLKLS